MWPEAYRLANIFGLFSIAQRLVKEEEGEEHGRGGRDREERGMKRRENGDGDENENGDGDGEQDGKADGAEGDDSSDHDQGHEKNIKKENVIRSLVKTRRKNGLRILGLDGGGIRALITLRLLETIEKVCRRHSVVFESITRSLLPSTRDIEQMKQRIQNK